MFISGDVSFELQFTNSWVCLLQFLPNTGDRAIATAAADSNVRIHNVETCETMQSYNCHIGRVKRLATAPSTSQVIYSASEDGTVR